MANLIISDSDVMTEGAQAFAVSSQEMSDAFETLRNADEELKAAWLGCGSERFELMKNATEAYCEQMTELTRI